MRLALSLALIFGSALNAVHAQSRSWELKSPDGVIAARVIFQDKAGLRFVVKHNGREIIEESILGLVANGVDFSSQCDKVSASRATVIRDKYEMLQGKRSKMTYEANEQSFKVSKSESAMTVTFRVSNDAVAFRYSFPDGKGGPIPVTHEKTVFNLPADSKGFLQPMSVAKSGWSRVNPCYEEHYQSELPVAAKSPLNNGWVYPALFRHGEKWVLISEAGLSQDYCATHLGDGNDKGEFPVVFPQPEEKFPGGGLLPSMNQKSTSPWRIIVVGGLKTIIESTAGTDLAAPAQEPGATAWVKPGHASWSWALLKDDSITYPVQKKYIDHAAAMGWDYCLIDVNWDVRVGYDKMRELVQYADAKSVGLILWYNSAGDWNDAPYTPRNVLLTRDSRLKEFERLRTMGVKGIKIDFFGGDGQSFIQYYHDILEDAAAKKLMVNFHGATIPRGWQRTYPHLVTVEAVKGFEYVTFEQRNADLQPSHCAMLPFTRNAFDPMDFTPLSLAGVPNINRRTSPAFELALPVIFLSGVQHFVETPEGMRSVPDFVKAFLRDLPVKWDETRFLSGYPGRDIALARRAGDTWFIAGVNGQDTGTTMNFDLSFIGNNLNGYVIKDGTGAAFERLPVSAETSNSVEVPSNGGFVMVITSMERP